jgi:hypothetical protein
MRGNGPLRLTSTYRRGSTEIKVSADSLIVCAQCAPARSPESDVSVRTAAGGESHQRRVEIGVRGRLLGAGRVAAELVPIAGPGTIGNPLSSIRATDPRPRRARCGVRSAWVPRVPPEARVRREFVNAIRYSVIPHPLRDVADGVRLVPVRSRSEQRPDPCVAQRSKRTRARTAPHTSPNRQLGVLIGRSTGLRPTLGRTSDPRPPCRASVWVRRTRPRSWAARTVRHAR